MLNTENFECELPGGTRWKARRKKEAAEKKKKAKPKRSSNNLLVWVQSLMSQGYTIHDIKSIAFQILI